MRETCAAIASGWLNVASGPITPDLEDPPSACFQGLGFGV